MAENFDLLGDPIPDSRGSRGRPPHIPTAKNRNKVMLLLAFDWSDRKIAAALGVTEPTFRKHYFRERKIRDDARPRVEATHLSMVWEQAKLGNVSAMKEFRKLMDRHDLRMSEREFTETLGTEKLGKKQVAALAAETAGTDSDWGNDLLSPARPH
jgi:hypothetical protein